MAGAHRAEAALNACAELLIIGAGPAGLALSSAYRGASRIFEQASEVGGLCRSVAFGGGVFDIGGHSFHTPHARVRDLVEDLMAGRWESQRRDARVAFNGDLIDYPFQGSIDQIADAEIRAECLAGLPQSPIGETDNFEDWIVARFGPGVARHFMLPYNRKLWGPDLRRMSHEWVSERVAGAEAPGQEGRRPLQRESRIAYPAEGGFVEIFRALAERCGPIEFGQRVTSIDAGARTLQTADGKSWTWDRLASTMSLPHLMRAIEGAPAELAAAADALDFVSLKVLLILVADQLETAPQRVYVADPQVPPHKIAFNHTSSQSLRRRPVHAIMAEIAWSPDRPLAADDVLTSRTIDWLAGAGLIPSPAAIIETRMLDIRYGYPVYTRDRAAAVDRIRAWLEPRGIHSFGRFGGWDYVNSDACILQGLTLADRLSRETAPI